MAEDILKNITRRMAATIFALCCCLPSAAFGGEEWVVAAFGDSLSAGYGLPNSQGFAPMLQRELHNLGAKNARVINAAVSGDTTADGLSRTKWMLADSPDLVVVEFGANDARRGFPPSFIRKNLNAIVAQIQSANADILIAGMLAPPNLGDDYAKQFNAIFSEIADASSIPLYPFFLEGVAANPALNQTDGIHPNAAGIAEIVRRIAPRILEILQSRARLQAEKK